MFTTSITITTLVTLLLTTTTIVSASASSSSSSPTFQSRCTSLRQTLHLNEQQQQQTNPNPYHNLAVTIAQYYAANSTIDQFADGTGTDASCAFPNPVVPVDLCRVALAFKTTTTTTTNATAEKEKDGKSEMVHMEAWLPEEWNERFLAVGTGGLAGCIWYQDLAYATQYGFATVSGNSGHNGTSGSAFFQAPEVLEDFVWRALYATTVVGKEVTRQFYSAPHRKAYFMGCSQGGRQGFKAAQRNPDMFDGMVVGAPGLRLPGLFQFFTRWVREVGTDLEGGNATVGVEAWSAVQNETLRQCDGLDGVEDGIIEETRRCRPDLSKLECGKVGAPAVCLTGKQLDLVDRFFSPWTVNDTLIYPGMVHNGDEASRATVLSTQTMGYVLEWPRYVSRQDPNWTLDQWTPADAVLAVQQNLFNFNTYDGDLSAFRDRGAKMIHYHGQLDNLVDTLVSDQYYDHVSKTMNASPSQLDEFYRYFRISGLQHCIGGPGASALGQGNGSPPPSDKPEDNVLLRIVEWVEGGDAPDTLRGTRFVNDDKAQGVDYRRKHCRYPKQNVYEGIHDGKDEDGWKCVD